MTQSLGLGVITIINFLLFQIHSLTVYINHYLLLRRCDITSQHT